MSIDYSPRGSTVNRDPVTGIRYGIISAHRIPHIWEDAEAVYWVGCPSCGSELREPDDEPEPDAPLASIADLEAAARRRAVPAWYEGDPCPSCGADIGYGEQYEDEPSHYTIGGPNCDTHGMVDSSGDVWCFRSPYFTRAAYCSPCAPGACYVGSPDPSGAQAYCLGPDYYTDDEPAPYPIWRVADGALVYQPGH